MNRVRRERIRRRARQEKGRLRSKHSARKEHRVIGKHVYGNLYGIKKGLLSQRRFLERTVANAVQVAGMHLVDVRSWSITAKQEKLGGGVSVIALLTESHIALHAWKYHGYATVDVYTCGSTSDPHAAFHHIRRVLKPRRYQLFYADRSDLLRQTR